jgi:FAD binding domain
VLPDSPYYQTARRAWNLAADLRPAAVCVATRVEHVAAAMTYARAHGLRVAAQTTGHLAPALPDLHQTLLLRLALHDGDVAVDPVTGTARVKAGAQWGDVVEAVALHGLAAMHGSSPTVGVTGYLLGGGLSFYGRAHGLAVNHVTAFEVVTADGTRRRVDPVHEPDLFYALRGGGSFAVVTAVEFGLLPYPEVTAGSMFFPAEDASALLRAWRDWSAGAPETITTTFRLLRLPPRPEVPEPLRAVQTVCIDGVALRPADAVTLEQRLRSVSVPILGGFGPMPSADVVRLHGDPEDPVPAIVDGILLDRLDDRAIEAFLQVAGRARRCSPPNYATSAERSPRPPPTRVPAGIWRATTPCSEEGSQAHPHPPPSSTPTSTATSTRSGPGPRAPATPTSPSGGARSRPAYPPKRWNDCAGSGRPSIPIDCSWAHTPFRSGRRPAQRADRVNGRCPQVFDDNRVGVDHVIGET